MDAGFLMVLIIIKIMIIIFCTACRWYIWNERRKSRLPANLVVVSTTSSRGGHGSSHGHRVPPFLAPAATTPNAASTAAVNKHECQLCLAKVPAFEWGRHKRECAVKNADLLAMLGTFEGFNV